MWIKALILSTSVYHSITDSKSQKKTSHKLQFDFVSIFSPAHGPCCGQVNYWEHPIASNKQTCWGCRLCVWVCMCIPPLWVEASYYCHSHSWHLDKGINYQHVDACPQKHAFLSRNPLLATSRDKESRIKFIFPPNLINCWHRRYPFSKNPASTNHLLPINLLEETTAAFHIILEPQVSH